MSHSQSQSQSHSQRQRRSARTTQPSDTPGAPSSNSSTSATRAERNTRVSKRTQSPRGSEARRSQSQSLSRSVDEVEGSGSGSGSGSNGRLEMNSQPPRRSRRGTEAEKEVEARLDEGEEDGETEEEVTRCICAQPEYPGPPAWIRERVLGHESVSDDVGNFFVQCDSCQVWQHGGCMGLTDESMLPEQYYCEQCRPGSHKIVTDRNGSKSSQYLPVIEASSSRSSSLSASEPASKNDKRQHSEASLSNAKRRATMNSRTALDDDELLRQAIEESKETGTLGKRTRDESEEYGDHTQVYGPLLTENSNRHVSKRQRTNSSSAPDPTKRSRSLSDGGSENGQGPNGTKDSKRIRGAAARNQREKELREKQKEKELAATQRAEAARKREARSERRRGEDSPPPTPTFSPSKLAGQPNKDTPPPPKSNINNLKNTHKGNARSHAARRGRLGRNQYTRDRDMMNGDVSDTPGREESHEGSPNGVNGESGRSSKAKTHGARTSMNEMKRRVAAILEFVGRMQGEGQTGANSRSSEGSGGTPNGTSISLPTASLVQAVEMAMGKGPGTIIEDVKEFREMGSSEMMDVLTRELIGWQNVYGRYGEK